MKYVGAIFVVLSFYQFLLGQVPQLHFNQLTTSDGLSQNTVNHILQDKYGQMWFCTLVGVDKYDGREFTKRVFKKNLTEEISTVFEWYKEEKILVATSKGLYAIDILDHKVDTLSTSYQSIVKIFYNRDSSAFYLFERDQVVLFDVLRQQIDSFTFNYTINDVEQKSADTFIIASGKDLIDFQPQETTDSRVLQSLPKEITTLHIDSLKQALYIGTQGLELYKYLLNGNTGITPYRIPKLGNNHSNSTITSILTNKNSLWVGTENSGLLLYKDGRQKNPILCLAEGNYQPKIDISSNKIRVLYASKDGVIWVGTNAGGLNIWQNKKQLFRHYFRGEYTSSVSSTHSIKIESLSTYDNAIWGVLLLNDSIIWLGTDQDGIAVLDLVNNSVIAKKSLPLRAEIELSSDLLSKAKTVFCFKRLGNRIYLGTDAGIFQTKDYWQYYHPTNFIGKGISLLEFDSIENGWWAGKRSKNKIYRLARKKFELQDSIILGQDETLSFIQKGVDSTMWIGTTNGLHKYQYDNQEWQKKDVFLAGKLVSCFWQSKSGGNLWLGTDGQGIYRYNWKMQNIDLVFDGNATTSEFLTDETIHSIVQDSFGHVWFSMNHGMGRLNPSDTTFNLYTSQDGLQSDEFNAGAVCADEEKQIFYFGGVNGLNSFQANNFASKEVQPKLTLLKYVYPSSEDKEGSGKIEQILSVLDQQIRLPNQFKYFELVPSFFDYHDLSNNQFRCQLNEGNYIYPTDGKFIFAESDFSNPFFSKNFIHIEYRTSRGGWQVHPPIRIIRDWFSWFYLFIIVTALGGSFLVWTLWLNSRSNKRLNRIQEKINDIARLETTDDLCALALDHFIDPKVFGFHYVLISFVNFYKKEIGIAYYCARKGKDIGYSEEWKKLSTYDLDEDKDTVVQVAHAKRAVKVVGRKVYDPEKEITDEALNEEIFKKFKHQRLARLFVPITHRTFQNISTENEDRRAEGLRNRQAESEQRDIVMGVVEAGYKLNILERFYVSVTKLFKINIKLRKEVKLDKNEVRLKLYADNFAQPFYRALLEEKRRELQEQIVESSEQISETHNEFMRNVLFQLADLFKVDYGNVAFRTFNSKNPDILDRGIYYGFETKEIVKGGISFHKFNEHRIGILHHVVNTKLPYFSGEVLEDKYYQRFFEEVQSEIGIPMLNDFDEVIGVLILSSKKKEFFNKFHSLILTSVISKAAESFTRIKQYNSLQKITSQFDFFSQRRLAIYEAAAASLEEYFDSDHISVWERDNLLEDENVYSLIYTSNSDLKVSYRDVNLLRTKVKEQPRHAKQTGMIKIQQMSKYENSSSRISQLCRSLEFESIVSVGILAEGKYQAFINIFSKRKLTEHFNRYSEKFLEQIAKNTGLAIQGISLIQAMEKISKSLSERETRSTLQVLVENAQELLRADLVALFPFKGLGRDVLLQDGYFAGNFPEHHRIFHKTQTKRRANIANYIIQHGTHWIENEQDYKRIFFDSISGTKSEERFQDSFWVSNKIKSVAAIRLEYNHQSLGVLFVNYLTSKDFSKEENKRFINAFTNFSTTALLNEDYISRIGEETQKLELEKHSLVKEKMELEKQKATIQFEYDIVYHKMEEMLPRATRTSFWSILQGINHDIRNSLIGIERMTYTLKQTINTFKPKERELLRNSLEVIDLQKKRIFNLLNLFKFGSTKHELVNINDLLEELLFFFQSYDQTINFEKSFDVKIPNIFCLKSELSMVIYNVLHNAVHAIEGNYKGNISIRTYIQDSALAISIRDTGSGITPEDLEVVFDFGYTTKKDGVGVGLFYVRKTIEEVFNGTVKVQSSVGKGTEFTIGLPLRP